METEQHLKQWYTRKASYGLSRVAHTIIEEIQTTKRPVTIDEGQETEEHQEIEEKRTVYRMLCRPLGAFAEGSLVEIASPIKRENYCPECLEKLKEKGMKLP